MQLPFTSAKDRLPSPDARSHMDAPINCLIPEETRRRRVGWFRPVPSPAWHDTGSVKGSERRNSLVDQDTRASSSTSPHLKFRAAKGRALAVPNNLGARTTPAFACRTTELPNPERLLPIRDTQQCQEGDAFRPLLRRTIVREIGARTGTDDQQTALRDRREQTIKNVETVGMAARVRSGGW